MKDPKSPKHGIHRRDLLKGAAAASLGLASGAVSLPNLLGQRPSTGSALAAHDVQCIRSVYQVRFNNYKRRNIIMSDPLDPSQQTNEEGVVNEIKPGVLRTPDHCFENLPGYPFEANYVEIDGLRVHYLDEGPKDADPILLMHGEPSWSYLYRKMIPGLVAAGHRCIAPDLIGFGKSDKLAIRNDYTYQFHIDTMDGFVKAVELKNITLFCQDWGSLIGIRVLIDNLDLFKRLIVANGGLPTGHGNPPEAFMNWLKYSQEVEVFPAGKIVNGGCRSDLSEEVIAAYNAPFPHEAYKEGARQFPTLVPITPDNPETENNKQGWKTLSQWEGPVLTLFSDSDPITKDGEQYIQKMMPGAKDQPHEIIQNGGHFVQEDQGEVLAEKIAAWLSN